MIIDLSLRLNLNTMIVKYQAVKVSRSLQMTLSVIAVRQFCHPCAVVHAAVPNGWSTDLTVLHSSLDYEVSTFESTHLRPSEYIAAHCTFPCKFSTSHPGSDAEISLSLFAYLWYRFAMSPSARTLC